jgi:hypothetical protein
MKIDHSHSIPTGILHFPLVAHLVSHRGNKEPVTNITHIEPPVCRGAYSEGLLTTQLLLISYFTKHSHSIVLIHCGGKQGILVRISTMQLSFHKTPIRKCAILHKVKIAKRNLIEG